MSRSLRAAAVAAASLLAVLAAAGRPAGACSTFCLARDGHVVSGRNYDFEIGDGLVTINPRGVAKTGLLDPIPAGAPRAAWVSAYGSATFNQFGRDFPTDGMNETGLVVALMWLDGTEYPEPAGRPAVGVLEWIQHQLDRFATVGEVIAHAEEIVVRGRTPLHYLVADATGDAATIEFLGGRLVVHRGASLPAPVLTNSTYDASVARLRRGPAVERRPGAPWAGGSLERFARAAERVARYDGGRPIVEEAFSILDGVAQGEATRWSVVYDMTERRVRFRTWNHPEIRTFSLAAFDLACGGPVKVLGVEERLAGDVTAAFRDGTAAANLALVAGSYSKVSFLRGAPRAEIEAVARHPESSRCAR